MTRLCYCLPVLVLALGCSNSSTGQVKASLTDSPTDLTNVKSIFVTVNSVRIHDGADNSVTITTADGGSADAGSTSDDATGVGWVELCDSPATEIFDLMKLTNGMTTALCGGRSVTVPAGHVSQARLGVVAAQLVFVDNSTQDLSVPSGSTSGFKINVDDDIPAGGILEIRFDFVAADSIVAKGDGTYSLKPVIKIAQ